ncbi:hypothetical protein GGF46_001972 [Coemansia sp. RSA 552]|nr:hypothetical protein GGF46_001972 [Coemansia sp. RSA 552]
MSSGERSATRRRRFEKRVLSAQQQQEMYEQNTMGATAGFVCAVVAAGLIGEPLSRSFTRFSYAETDDPVQYRFGARDAAPVVLGACLFLFARAYAYGRVLRPLAAWAVPSADYARKQRLAGAMLCIAVQVALVCAGVIMAAPVLATGPAAAWKGYGQGVVGFAGKAAVIAVCAHQVAGMAALAIETPAGYRSGMAKRLLALCGVAGAGVLGALPVVGAAIAAAALRTLRSTWADCKASAEGAGAAG